MRRVMTHVIRFVRLKRLAEALYEVTPPEPCEVGITSGGADGICKTRKRGQLIFLSCRITASTLFNEAKSFDELCK